MWELYIILSVVGWAWCLPALAFLFFRLRKDARPDKDRRRGGRRPRDGGGGDAGREEVAA